MAGRAKVPAQVTRPRDVPQEELCGTRYSRGDGVAD